MKGKGNYSGSITKTFVINPLNLSVSCNDGTPMFQADDITLAYNGKVQKGTTKVTYVNEAGKTVTLKAKKDFEYTYPDKDETVDGKRFEAYKDAKETPYTVTIVGKGNYTGKLEIKQTITQSVPVSQIKVSAIPVQEYNEGEAVKPALTLKYKGETLKEYNEETKEGHYTLQYKNNKLPGNASVIIAGVKENGYVGTRTITFKINGYNLKKAKIEGFQSSYIYTGDEIKQEKVKFSYTIGKGETAKVVQPEEGKHYTVTYTKNENVGTATVVYTGIVEKGWTGSIKKTFKIKAYDVNSDTEKRITVSENNGGIYPYVKGGTKPSLVVKYTSPAGKEYILTEGMDYKLSYLNNKKLSDGSKIPTIKITGKGNFKGTRQKDTFTIISSDISKLNAAAADKVFVNKKGKFTTSVVITDTDGKKLKAGTDYEKKLKYYYYESVNLADGTEREAGDAVDEKDIVPAGAVIQVVVTGKGNYHGSISALYRVVEADIAKASVKVNKQYYTGKEICPDKSQIVITLKGEVLSANDYEIVSYTNNKNKGNAKITVKGVGYYGGSKTVNFTIANKSMYYVIAFNANGGTSGSMKDMRVQYGKSYNLIKNTYKKRGYNFIGWNTEPDGSGTDVQGNVLLFEDKAKDPIVVGKEDIGTTLILYAQWEIATYNITYKLNGGTISDNNPSTYTINDEIKLNEPVKKGYAFAGWYTDSKYTTKITSIKKGSVGNKTLYAKWRESFVGEVEKPEEGTYLDVRDYGAYPNDNKDDTSLIEYVIELASENAASDGITTVYVPAGTYIITPEHAYNVGEPGISLKSNVNLVMDNEAVLNVKGSPYGEYCVFSIKNVSNVTIQGGKIQGERYRHTGSGGESGHGIAIYGSENVTISNVSVCSNWGDGIYIGTQPTKQDYVGCNNVTIQNCDIFDNRRSNISIVDGDNVTIDHCFIFDAHGTAPQCGINIEPNSNSSGDKICKNITIKDTTIRAYQNINAPEYMCFMTVHNPYVSNFTTADNIRFINSKFYGFVGNYSGKNLQIDGKTVITGEFVNLR